MSEPNVTINGQQLTEAQAMTMRVALSNFVLVLNGDGLGTDEHGKRMIKTYQERLNEIFRMIAST